jgi:hypothetical protein
MDPFFIPKGKGSDSPVGRVTKFADFFGAPNAIQFKRLPSAPDFSLTGFRPLPAYNMAWGGFARANSALT